MAKRRRRHSSRAGAIALLALPLASCAGWIASAAAQAPADFNAYSSAYQTAYNDYGLGAPFTGGAPAPTRPVYRMSAVDWRPKSPAVERTPPTDLAPAMRIEGEPIPTGAATPASAIIPVAQTYPASAASPTPTPDAPATRTVITSEGRINVPAQNVPTPAAPLNQPSPVAAAATPAGNVPTPADPSGLPPRVASQPTPAAGPTPADPAYTQPGANNAPTPAGPTGQGIVRRIGSPTPADPDFQGWDAARSREPADVAMNQDGPPAGPPPAPGEEPLITGGEVIVAPPPHEGDDLERGYWHVGQRYFDPRCKNPNLLSPEERRWYTRGEFLYWQREGASPQNIAFSDDTNEIVLDAGTLTFDYQQGVRLAIGKILDKKSSIEFSMFNILRQTENEVVTSDTDDIVSFFAVGAGPGFVVDAFDFASRQSIEYSSDIYNFETNYLRDIRAPYNLRSHVLIGLRNIMLFENFDYESNDVLLGQRGEYHIDAQDYMFGPQVGGAVEYPLGDGWWVSLRGKAGLLINQVHQQSRIEADDVEVQFNEGHKWTASGLTELGLFTRIELSERAEIHLGYEALFLSGVGLATEQIDFSTSFSSQGSVDAQSSLFYHGITAGSTIRW